MPMQIHQARWTEPTRNPQAEDVLAHELRIHATTARLLVNRGLSDPAEADAFLHPSLSQLHDPFGLPDMDKAARRIADAIQAKEKIFVYGDYDVDGVTSTAVYVRALIALGANIIYRVPHRKKDGYDLRTTGVQWAHEQQAKLVITSDCGIQSLEAVDLANTLGMTVIVTDHHEPGGALPNAYAIVNPHRHDSTYAWPHIAGVGVAFKVMQAVTRLLQPMHEGAFIQKFLDLVACGTVADVMPLQGENRVFASLGLLTLPKTRKVGLRALLDGAGLDLSKPLTSESVGFGIGPRINAVGRLGDAAQALDLLLTGDPEEALRIVKDLNAFNIERQGEQARILKEARAMMAAQDMSDVNVLVLASPGWNAGVVGIVAGKLVDDCHRPAIVIGTNDDGTWGKGSARSIAAFNLFDGIQDSKFLLETCGGHAMAAGLSLFMTNFDDFRQRINDYAGTILTPDHFVPEIAHDGTIDPSELSLPLLKEWERLAPFGHANPAPLFASTEMLICDAKRMGKDMSHLKLRVRADAMDPTDCVAWGRGDFTESAGPGDKFSAVYSPQVNEWNGRSNLQLVLKDLRKV